MDRNLIIARIQPGAEPDVARVFGESDATSLPLEIGVRERSLYALGDLYVHVVDFDTDAEQAMSRAQRHTGFHDISQRLRPYIDPYLATWQGPRDAIARRFYHWRADG